MFNATYTWVASTGSVMPSVNEMRVTGLRKLATAKFRKPSWSGNALRFLSDDGWGFDAVKSFGGDFYVDLIKVEDGFVVFRSPLTRSEWSALLESPSIRLLCLAYPMLRRCRGSDELYNDGFSWPAYNLPTYWTTYSDTTADPSYNVYNGTDTTCVRTF